MFKDLLHILISITYYHCSHFNVKGLYEVTFTLKFVTQVVQTNNNFDMCRGVMAYGCMAIVLKHVEAN